MRKITAITAFLSLCAVFIFSVTSISTAEEPVLETEVIPLHIAAVNCEPTEDISVMKRNFDQHVHDVWRLGINGDDYKK